MTRRRLLFASIHSYLDHSSGAAMATRDLLELLAAHGWDCRAFTCGVLDYEQETPLEDVLGALERPSSRAGRRSPGAGRSRSSTSSWTACGSPCCRRPTAALSGPPARARPPFFSTWPSKCWSGSGPRFS